MAPIKRPCTARHERIEGRDTLFRRRRMSLMAEAGEDVKIVVASETVSARHDGIYRGTKRGPILGSREIRRERLGGTQLLPPQSRVADMTT